MPRGECAPARPAVRGGDSPNGRDSPAQAGRGRGWRFGIIELREPDKAALLAGGPGAREALVTCWNRADGRTYKAVVSLDDDQLLDWNHREGEQANLTEDEFHDITEALRKHPRVVEALHRHGVEDMDFVVLDTWAYGAHLIPERYRGRRVGWTDVWVRDSEGSNPYAHPAERADFRGRRQCARAAGHRGGRRRPAAPDHGRVRARAGARPAAARRPEAARGKPARRAQRDERYPCGEFPVQADEDAGLPAWTAANRRIENTDVVLWYVFGIHHVTRPEEWPVMAVDTVSFWLKPFGFFDRNPALDVPPR